MIEKLKFIIYKDELFQEKEGREITVQVNPEDFTEEKALSFQSDDNSGPQFKGTENESITIKFTIDGTGVVPSEKPVTVSEKIEELETYLYSLHENKDKVLLPYYVLISWGKLFFKGRLQSMNVHYTLFKGNGEPLRAVVTLGFLKVSGDDKKTSSASKDAIKQEEKDKLITVKSGDTLPFLCRREYGDSTLCEKVADHNKLTSIRGIKEGDKLIFPKQ